MYTFMQGDVRAPEKKGELDLTKPIEQAVQYYFYDCLPLF